MESSSDSDDDPENEAFNYMESFYQLNYSCHEIINSKDYCDKKVWNIHYDDNYDIIYVFFATLQRNNCGHLLNTVNINSNAKPSNKDLSAEFEALEIYRECDVTLKL